MAYTISSGESIDSVNLINNHMYIYGTANYTLAEYLGWMGVYYGGVANSTTLRTGYISVSSGGIANSTTIDSGTMWVNFSGSANDIKLLKGGYLYIYSGGKATNVDWTPFVGRFHLDAGGQVSFVSTYSGIYYGTEEELISRETTMDSKTIENAYQMYVMSGGVANSTMINENGNVYVFTGGIVNETIVNPAGGLYIYADGKADGITVNGGDLHIGSGASATGIIWTP